LNWIGAQPFERLSQVRSFSVDNGGTVPTATGPRIKDTQSGGQAGWATGVVDDESSRL